MSGCEEEKHHWYTGVQVMFAGVSIERCEDQVLPLGSSFTGHVTPYVTAADVSM